MQSESISWKIDILIALEVHSLPVVLGFKQFSLDPVPGRCAVRLLFDLFGLGSGDGVFFVAVVVCVGVGGFALAAFGARGGGLGLGLVGFGGFGVGGGGGVGGGFEGALDALEFLTGGEGLVVGGGREDGRVRKGWGQRLSSEVKFWCLVEHLR